MNTARTMKMVVASLVAITAFGATGCSAQMGNSTRDQIVPGSDTPSRTQPAEHTAVASKEPGKDSVSTSSTAKKGTNGAQSDKYSQVHMQYWNNTNEVLNLVSAKRNGTPSSSAHWENQAPTSLQPGAVGTASSYAAGDASVTLVYQGADDGVQFTIYGETPNTAGNQTSGQANSASYTVTHEAGTGLNPTDWFHMQVGHSFTFTGHTEQYVVPAGVTSMKVTAIGGSGMSLCTCHTDAGGAQISGTLAVTPGEVLTVGVGGSPQVGSDAVGGWGMANGDSSFSGGDGTGGAARGFESGGGGGATVVQDPNGELVVVSGGGGGQGAVASAMDGYYGGAGGSNGSLTGGIGQPGNGAGGKPGANSVSRGQDSQGAGVGTGGAGGGGVNGGMAGISGTSGGGGAGSSSDDGLTNTTVSAGPAGNSSDGQVGEVTFGPAS